MELNPLKFPTLLLIDLIVSPIFRRRSRVNRFYEPDRVPPGPLGRGSQGNPNSRQRGRGLTTSKNLQRSTYFLRPSHEVFRTCGSRFWNTLLSHLPVLVLFLRSQYLTEVWSHTAVDRPDKLCRIRVSTAKTDPLTPVQRRRSRHPIQYCQDRNVPVTLLSPYGTGTSRTGWGL